MTTEVLVVGCGAIGGTLSRQLIERGHRVLVVEQDPAQRAAVEAYGLSVVGAGGSAPALRPSAVYAPEPDTLPQARFECVLLAVKSQDTESAMRWIAPRLAPTGYVVSCQNGDNESLISRHVGISRVVAAFVDIAADAVAPGIIRAGGVTRLVVGELDGEFTDRVSSLRDLLPEVIEVSDNIRGLIWTKRVLAALYTMTALADLDTADLIDRHRQVMLAVAREVIAVADAGEVRLASLGYFDAAAVRPNASPERVDQEFDRLVRWQHTIAKKRVGPFRDIAIRRRRTEAHVELASLCAAAARHGIGTPSLTRLDQMLTELEEGRRPFTEANLSDFETSAFSSDQGGLR